FRGSCFRLFSGCLFRCSSFFSCFTFRRLFGSSFLRCCCFFGCFWFCSLFGSRSFRGCCFVGSRFFMAILSVGSFGIRCFFLCGFSSAAHFFSSVSFLGCRRLLLRFIICFLSHNKI